MDRDFDTQQLHVGQEKPADSTQARAVPIYASSSFVFESAASAADIFAGRQTGNQYGRMHNPTVDVFVDRIVALAGGAAGVAFSSGQAAETAALMAVLTPGSHIVLSNQLFGGTYAVINKVFVPWGVTVSIVEPEAGAIAAAITDRTAAVWVETIANPSGTVPDLPAISQVCRQAAVPFMVDNTFGCAGYLCRPIEQGADVVIESATKWIGGHGTFIGGVMVDAGSYDWANGRFPAFTTAGAKGSVVDQHGHLAFAGRVRDLGLFTMGMTLSPFAAFLALQGLETLSLRVQRSCDSAMELANWLEAQPQVQQVQYAGLESHPSHEVAGRVLQNGFGAVLAFDLGSAEAAAKCIDRLQLASHLANIGDARTVVIQPWTTTHAGMTEEGKLAAGVTPGLIRVSTGLESVRDIIGDFHQAITAG